MNEPSTQQAPIKVAALYRFVRIDDPLALRRNLLGLCDRHGIRGTLIVAREGLNGTVAGPAPAIDAMLDALGEDGRLAGLDVKFSAAAEMPFHRLKVRVKREIVTMGVEGIDPLTSSGTYVEARDWNALIGDADTVVIDTRNDYEVKLGSFAGAIDPKTTSFRDFPQWVEENRATLQGRRVAMFCTGGIRCEKATAYLKGQGIDQVFHLRGGILKYLEDVPRSESLWEGECFVFDERVSVTHGLGQGSARLCRACRTPLSEADQLETSYVEGVSCPHCIDKRSDEDRRRYAERHRQVSLAGLRGTSHIGAREDR